MKKIIYIIGIFITALLYTSCDLLDLAPEDYYGSENFWNKKAEVDGFMIGMHSQLRENYAMFYVLGELRGGTQRVGTSSENTSLDYADVRSNLIDKDKTGITNWYGLYSPIMQVNHFILKVERECSFLTDEERNYYLGQAYGLRSLYYFMLYKTFGGVPIVTEVEILNGKASAEKFYVERATATATMEFIKKDVNTSEQKFKATTTGNAAPTKAQKTMWSKYATLMLKAEIYTWAAKVSISGFEATGTPDLTIAQTTLKELDGKFALEPQFSDVFNTAKKNNDEIIFAIHFNSTEVTNWAGMFLYQDAVFIDQVYDRNGNKITKDTLNLKGTGGVFRHEYKESFWKTYNAKDTRRDATFLEYYVKDKDGKASFGCVMKKGIGSINTNGNRVYDTDIIIYRYADYLLLRAEVENGLGNPCATYINEVRKRAYGAATFAADISLKYTNADFAENEMAILKERDKEFVWEGKRWFDVLRLQDASKKSLIFSPEANYMSTVTETPSSLISVNEAYKKLWPINIGVLNINPLLTQTPGY